MKNSLPSWTDTPTKKNILDFVDSVTDIDSPTFVPPPERIAVFDNDGTLWCEKPMYIQFNYILRRLAIQAESEPALRAELPWKAAWEKNFSWLGGAVTKHYQGDDGDFQILLKGILSLSGGVAVEEVESAAREFIENERHPTLNIPYKDCIYQPMLELLRYLDDYGFINYIVSGGGRDFMRGFASNLYDVPRERLIGSTVAYQFVENKDSNKIVQKAELDVVDDGPGKPIQIWNVIGRRPILAAGNSNGDIEMLKFAQGSGNPFLNLLLLHDDPQREFEYTAGAEKVIRIAQTQAWTTISMKDDFIKIFS